MALEKLRASTPILTAQVPYSEEAEMGVIGAILVNPDMYPVVAAFLKPEQFYMLRNRLIYEVFARLEAQKFKIDYITVTDALRAAGYLADIGGPAYLTQLINETPTSLHAEIYGRIVERAAMRRDLLAAADEIKRLAFDEDLDIDEARTGAVDKVLNAARSTDTPTLKPLSVYVQAAFDELETVLNSPTATIGIPTGFGDLDTRFGGNQKSELIVKAGRPGHGKSAHAMQEAVNAATTVNPVTGRPYVGLFRSLEMKGVRLAQRYINGLAKVDSTQFRTLRNDPSGQSSGMWSRLLSEAGKAPTASLFVDDKPYLTPTGFRMQLKFLQAEYGLDFAVLDYLQLMRVEETNRVRFRNREQEVSYCSRSLKEYALEFDIPITACAQLSREVEKRADKRPMLSDLRESGAIEQDSDRVCFCYWPFRYEPNVVDPTYFEYIVAKNRDNATGIVPMRFERQFTRFSDAKVITVDLTAL